MRMMFVEEQGCSHTVFDLAVFGASSTEEVKMLVFTCIHSLLAFNTLLPSSF